METLRFKKRGDLVRYAHKHPGALAARFLFQVRQELGQGVAISGEDVTNTDPTVWSVSQANFKEVRGQREEEEQIKSRLSSKIEDSQRSDIADA